MLFSVGDFQDSSHHQSILYRAAVIRFPPPDFYKTPRSVQRPGSAIRLSNLEKSRSHSAGTELDQKCVEHLARQTLAAKFRLDSDVQNLPIFANRERYRVRGNR